MSLWRPELGIHILGARVTDGLELNMGLSRAACAFYIIILCLNLIHFTSYGFFPWEDYFSLLWKSLIAYSSLPRCRTMWNFHFPSSCCKSSGLVSKPFLGPQFHNRLSDSQVLTSLTSSLLLCLLSLECNSCAEDAFTRSWVSWPVNLCIICNCGFPVIVSVCCREKLLWKSGDSYACP